MVLSGIYILDMKGKVLISRNYRGDIENNVIEKFIGLVMDKEEEILMGHAFRKCTSDVLVRLQLSEGCSMYTRE